VFCYEQHVLPFLKSLAPKEGDHLFILKVLGWPESVLDQMLRKMRWPVGVDVGFRTSLPENHIKILVRARSRAAAFKKIHKQVKSIQKKIGSALFSTNADESFGEIFLRDLLSKRHRLVTAESCTGGLVSSIVTAIPGSSDAFERGFVVYSNQSKQDLLGVSEKTLQQQGAVSEACVHELLDGVFKRTQATCGIAISGIAGPSGGTKKKPVGSIWIAAGTRKKRRTKLLQLGFSRELNQKFSAYAALQMLRELI
jgi:nicotinamide-nucleotide amidase